MARSSSLSRNLVGVSLEVGMATKISLGAKRPDGLGNPPSHFLATPLCMYFNISEWNTFLFNSLKYMQME